MEEIFEVLVSGIGEGIAAVAELTVEAVVALLPAETKRKEPSPDDGEKPQETERGDHGDEVGQAA